MKILKRATIELLSLYGRLRRWKIKNWWAERTIRNLRIREEILLKRDAVERADIAMVFNLRYCIAVRFDRKEEGHLPGDTGQFGQKVKKGNRWMCPSCNTIHAPVRHESFRGIIYPACCNLREGSRHDDLPNLATLKRPLGMYGWNALSLKLRRAGLEERGEYLGSI